MAKQQSSSKWFSALLKETGNPLGSAAASDTTPKDQPKKASGRGSNLTPKRSKLSKKKRLAAEKIVQEIEEKERLERAVRIAGARAAKNRKSKSVPAFHKAHEKLMEARDKAELRRRQAGPATIEKNQFCGSLDPSTPDD